MGDFYQLHNNIYNGLVNIYSQDLRFDGHVYVCTTLSFYILKRPIYAAGRLM